LNEYTVEITETLQLQVTVGANSAADALQAVVRGYKNSDHILDEQHLTGTDFKLIKNADVRIIYWLKYKCQTDNALNLYVHIPAGITVEQAAEIESKINIASDYHGNQHDDDYANFDWAAIIENILDNMGIDYTYPPADYVIYL